MIRINLLPHREEKRKARRLQFYVLSGLVSVLAGLIVFLGWSIISTMVNAQKSSNDFLKAENEKLDKQIAQIKTLKDEINVLLAKKKVIEDLQRERGRAVSLMNEMVRLVPEGIFLKSLRQDNLRVTLNGISQSNSRVSEMMRNFAQSSVVELPRLVETRAATVDRKKMQEFNLSVQIKQIKDEDPKKGPVAGAAVPGQEAKK
jgi:type IV pilus assembly protein PilN